MGEINIKENNIIRNIKEGNKNALKELMDIYYVQLVYFAFNILNSREDAEEIVQDVFITMWNDREKIDVKYSIKSYLYTSVKNRVINYTKSKFSRIKKSEEKLSDNIEIIYEETGIEAKELKVIIKNAIVNLPEKCRLIFCLSRNTGLTYKEIASELNISVNTVENHMVLALKRIREYIKLRNY